MKAKARKVLALLLCLVMLAGTMMTTVSAASNGKTQGSASTSIEDVSEIMNAMSYTKYREKYAKVGKGKTTIVLSALDYDKEKTTADVSEIDGHYGVDDALLVPEIGTVAWKFVIPEDALYTIQIEYCQYAGKTNSIERVF